MNFSDHPQVLWAQYGLESLYRSEHVVQAWTERESYGSPVLLDELYQAHSFRWSIYLLGCREAGIASWALGRCAYALRYSESH